jgi:uncharacterized heparinase superfamily protein
MNHRSVLQMGVDELATRGRQEAMKWLDRTLGTESIRPAGTPLDLERRFFRGATEGETVGALNALDPDLARRTVERADAVCEGRFDLLGYSGLFFGRPIDWHLDPLSGRRTPQVHWSRIDPLDQSTIGDARLVWELNRHGWLVVLGRAHVLTGEERYAEVVALRLRDWMLANPPGLGINWTSSLEIGIRLIAWCWAMSLLHRSRPFSSARLLSLMRDWIAAHATHVARYLSSYHSPNTHLTGEALALFYAGVLFPELSPAWRWRCLGDQVLSREIHEQVLADGVYFEQSTGYQRYTVEFYLHYLVLAALHGVAIAPELSRRVQEMLDFLLYARGPQGRLPQIGDGDGGTLVPLGERDADDPSDLFSTAAVLFERRDYAWAAGDLAPETVWLLGSRAVSAFRALKPAPPCASPSRLFAAGGYAVFRSDWGRDAHQLLFDVGPLGCPTSAGHGHADLLSVQCCVAGAPYLVDPGTFVYTRHPDWRRHFRSSAAHSTMRIDDVDQAEPDGPFRWRTRPRARIKGWASSATADFACAEHDAYARLAEPVTHRRTVVFAKPDHFIVVDDLLGDGEHTWELRYQFAPMSVSIEADGWLRARGEDGHALLLHVVTPVTFSTRIAEGARASGGGWVSAIYGRRVPAPLVVFAGTARLPLRVATILVPLRDPDGPAPSVSDVVQQSFRPLLGSGLGAAWR